MEYLPTAKHIPNKYSFPPDRYMCTAWKLFCFCLLFFVTKFAWKLIIGNLIVNTLVEYNRVETLSVVSFGYLFFSLHNA